MIHRGCQDQRIFERKHTGHTGRGEFTETVAYDHRGRNSPVLPQSGQCILNTEQSGRSRRRKRRGARCGENPPDQTGMADAIEDLPAVIQMLPE